MKPLPMIPIFCLGVIIVVFEIQILGCWLVFGGDFLTGDVELCERFSGLLESELSGGS